MTRQDRRGSTLERRKDSRRGEEADRRAKDFSDEWGLTTWRPWEANPAWGGPSDDSRRMDWIENNIEAMESIDYIYQKLNGSFRNAIDHEMAGTPIRLVKKPYVEPMYREDVAFLKRGLRALGYEASDEDIAAAWRAKSHDMNAGWLMVCGTEEEAAKSILDYLEEAE